MDTPAARGRRSRRVLESVLLIALCMALSQTVRAEGRCEAAEHGLRTESTDNTAALTKILGDCAGQTIHIRAGTYLFAPQGFALGIKMPANTSLVGDGAEHTTFKVANSGNFQAFLWVRNVSHVTIHGLRFEGSSYDSGCNRHLDYGHGIFILSDRGQSAGVESIDISDNVFHNFNGQGWVTIQAADQSPGIYSVDVQHNVLDSDASLSGGCAASGGMGYQSAMVSLHGSDMSAQGLVRSVNVVSNTFNAGYVKVGVAVWSGTKDIDIKNNTISETGSRLPRPPNTDVGRYAILVYNSAHEGARELPGLHPDMVTITGNTISNPYSCGIYVARGQNVEITDNRISGQTDRFDNTLPKGAIALNHAERMRSVARNELDGNYIGISSVGSGDLKMGQNRIKGGIPTKIH